MARGGPRWVMGFRNSVGACLEAVSIRLLRWHWFEVSFSPAVDSRPTMDQADAPEVSSLDGTARGGSPGALGPGIPVPTMRIEN